MSKTIRKYGLFFRETEQFIGFCADPGYACLMRDSLVIPVEIMTCVMDETGQKCVSYHQDLDFSTTARWQASELLKRVSPLLWSNPLKPGDLEKALEAGLLPKKDLVDGKYYYGYCRNARVARWDANGKPRVGVEEGPTGRFVHIRHKFGSSFPESINHPEDDNGYDFFVPVAEIEPLEAERVDDESLRSTR